MNGFAPKFNRPLRIIILPSSACACIHSAYWKNYTATSEFPITLLCRNEIEINNHYYCVEMTVHFLQSAWRTNFSIPAPSHKSPLWPQSIQETLILIISSFMKILSVADCSIYHNSYYNHNQWLPIKNFAEKSKWLHLRHDM